MSLGAKKTRWVFSTFLPARAFTRRTTGLPATRSEASPTREPFSWRSQVLPLMRSPLTTTALLLFAAPDRSHRLVCSIPSIPTVPFWQRQSITWCW